MNHQCKLEKWCAPKFHLYVMQDAMHLEVVKLEEFGSGKLLAKGMGHAWGIN